MVLILAFLCFVGYAAYKFIVNIFRKKEEKGGYEESWYGKEQKVEGAEEDDSVRPFQINVPDSVLDDLKVRLGRTRLEESLQDSSFHNGFNSQYLREVLQYWKNEYDWRKAETTLNGFPQFKTKIEGIDVHFLHVKPDLESQSGVKVLPLLLVHGWPGSIVEFLKVIPLLTALRNGRAFEIVCPSIPGYGFSESPHRQGFNQRATARFFVTLMQRLGHSSFYTQGGDWGCFITLLIAKYYPAKVPGLHVNMWPEFSKSPLGILKLILVSYFPFLVSKAEYSALFPLKKKFGFILRETGYFHLQATKPDTVGCGLSDSPIGLAAYILEKFSTWTDKENVSADNGNLTKKFSLDELLTNVMLYWVNNNVTASVRYYKEFFNDPDRTKHEKLPVTVPAGIALFPNELQGIPKMLLPRDILPDLVSYTLMARGGHFGAFEEPHLLADDFWKFVEIVEQR